MNDDIAVMTPSEDRELGVGGTRMTFANKKELLREFAFKQAKWQAITDEHDWTLWMRKDHSFVIDLISAEETARRRELQNDLIDVIDVNDGVKSVARGSNA